MSRSDFFYDDVVEPPTQSESEYVVFLGKRAIAYALRKSSRTDRTRLIELLIDYLKSVGVDGARLSNVGRAERRRLTKVYERRIRLLLRRRRARS